jgi:hypothetical protein
VRLGKRDLHGAGRDIVQRLLHAGRELLEAVTLRRAVQQCLHLGTAASVRFMAEHGSFFSLLEAGGHTVSITVITTTGDPHVELQRAEIFQG